MSDQAAVGRAPWEDARNVLCVRLDNLGDVLMSTPAIHAVRCARRDRRLTLMCAPEIAGAVRHLPDVDACISYAAPWVKASQGERDSGLSEAQVLDQLRAAKFDAAIIFTVFSQSALPAALMCRWAGIPRVLAHSRENPYALLTDWCAETDALPHPRHEVKRQLDLVGSVGMHSDDHQLRFSVSHADITGMRRKFAALGLRADEPFVLLHPGATAPSRRYPADRFGLAAQGIHRRAGLPIVVGGTAGERSLAQDVCSHVPAGGVNVAGMLTLGEYAAAIAAAALLVSNNTGPVHLAAALQTPVVDLYAQTNPQHTPWGVQHRVLSYPVPCGNCLRSVCPQGHHDCLARLPYEAVVDAALELLASAEPSAAGDAAAQATFEDVA